MNTAVCPRCHRPRLVVGADSKKRTPRIRQHQTTGGASTGKKSTLCPGSGTPVRTQDITR